MILLFIGAALAQPTAEQLEDAASWEQASRRLLDGPDSCVELEGHARFTLALFTPGGWLGPGERRDLSAEGTFSGTLDHGAWTRLETTWAPAAGDGDDLSLDRVHPMVGRPPPDVTEGEGNLSIGISNEGTQIAAAGGGEQALGLLDEIINDIDPSVTTSYAQWDPVRRAVVLRQFVPLPNGSDDLEIRTFFPEGGPPPSASQPREAMSVDAIFPARAKLGDDLVKVTVLNAQLHLRGQRTPMGVLPGQEGASLVLGVLGFTVGVEQRLTYDRYRPCSTPDSPP